MGFQPPFFDSLPVLQIEATEITVEDYNQLVCELKQLQNDRSTEVQELIYLRWCNACLRHELTRMNQEHQEQLEERKNQLKLNFSGSREIEDFEFDHESDGTISGHDEPCFDSKIGHHTHAHSKRRNLKLIEKFKRWVEGSEKRKQKLDEKEEHEFKCFGKHSVSDSAEEGHLPPRKSCSSA